MKTSARFPSILNRTLAALCCLWMSTSLTASGQTVSGIVRNNSTWKDNVAALTPPGDGNNTGDIAVGLWSSATIIDAPLYYSVASSGAMPQSGSFPYAVNIGTNGGFNLVAWVDANQDGKYDQGEPRSAATAIAITNSVGSLNLIILDDSDNDGLPDWWEVHWFIGCADPLSEGGSDDPDNDGLSNLQEYNISVGTPVMSLINPANWDTDGDGMDDKWEYDHYYKAGGYGLNPTTNDAASDIDGDGLSNWQEYNGVDGTPLMQFDKVSGCSVAGKTTLSKDDLNPLDIDSDFDLLIDSYEGAWYDPTNNIDPHASPVSTPPLNTISLDFSIAKADPDQDGLSNYREMCLLSSFNEGGANEDKWVWQNEYPLAYQLYTTDDGKQIRVVRMDFTGVNLSLGVNPNFTLNTVGNLTALRNHEWTDPTDGTGYTETQSPGHDTDGDFLPDGWEVEFGLDPRDPGTSTPFTNGPFGDPDGDGLLNIEEYLGQDGQRSATFRYINGTGDETNPNVHHHRPDSTYSWRWLSTNEPESYLTDPRAGNGINRFETLGSALPTASIGADSGLDTDDDGISDIDELGSGNGQLSSCPVISTDPFRPKAALITSPNGILIPDPEPASASLYFPAGIREDLHRRAWTIECDVKLLAPNMSGSIFNFQTALGASSRTVYNLSLSNNVPSLMATFASGNKVVTANALPTNQWIHLAGVFDPDNNALTLYIQGIISMNVNASEDQTAANLALPATNVLAFGASSDGSFVNQLLLDEIRIWGVARSPKQLSDFARNLIPQGIGDDVWLDSAAEKGAVQVYFNRGDHPDTVIINGGSLFEGEPGVVLSNVMCSGHNGAAGTYSEGEDVWIDLNGDGKYTSYPPGTDILLKNGGKLSDGEIGALLTADAGGAVTVVYNDKDQSGGFTLNSLLAYYRFDDGGTTIEDFARKAQSGLLRASSESYMFGDQGYALPIVGFTVVTNDAAPTLGVDARASDDSDHDGMPDAWEIINGLNPNDDGTGGESTPGAKNGPNGPNGDPDGDGLNNIYEYRSDTNPHAADSDGNGILDTLEDFDGDGLANITEQSLGSRPDIVDTDDDGKTDSEELSAGTNPAEPTDPPVARSMGFGGSPNDYLEVPLTINQALYNWTLEAQVNPSNAVAGVGTIIRRSVQDLPGGSNALNYALGLEPDGSGGLRAYGGFVQPNGVQSILHGGTVPTTGGWTHLAITYKNDTNTSSTVLYLNGSPVASTTAFTAPSPEDGKGGNVFLRIGEDFGGLIDEVRIWQTARSAALIASNANNAVDTTDTNLVHYFRFDDGQANTNSLPFGPFHQPHGAQDSKFQKDWDAQWRHAAVVHGNVSFVDAAGIIPPPSLRVVLLPGDAITLGAQWIVDGGTANDSGVTLTALSAGLHSITYSAVAGYISPVPENVTLTNGTVVTLTRQYVLEGSLKIHIDPASISTNGGIWTVDGGSINNSDDKVTLAPGNHTVTYKTVPGWTSPTNETVTIQSGVDTVLTRTYSGDTDGDGLPDWWEQLYFGCTTCADPNADPDGDGLTNLQEFQFGTNPTLIDTDGDGFSDLNEILRGSDPLDPNSVPPKMEINDFDGDGATDISVFWPATGNWYIRQSSAGFRSQNWGWSAAIPVPSDYDGDNVTDVAVFWPDTGQWFILQSNTHPNSSRTVTWVGGAVIPVPGDYDGDNFTDFAVYKPQFGNWYIAFNTPANPAITRSVNWGWSETTPLTGDFDGDGVSDIAVYYPQGGLWYILRSSDGTMQSGAPIQWGWNAVTPVPGDYDGDRKTDLAVYDQASGTWYIRKSSDGKMLGGGPIQWGWSAAVPVPGDYDNDGKTDIAVYYPQGGLWYIRKSSDGTLFTGAPVQFGWSAAVPPGAP